MPEDDDDFTGKMATVTGWGRLKYGKWFKYYCERQYHYFSSYNFLSKLASFEI